MSLNSSTNNIVNSNSIGLNGQSDFQYQGSVAYNTNLWGASLQGNYTSGPHLANPQNADLADILTFDDYWLFNLGGYYNLSEKLTFRATVSSLTRRKGQPTRLPLLALAATTGSPGSRHGALKSPGCKVHRQQL